MNGNIFLDTNVLVYAYDRSEPIKQGFTMGFLEEISSLRVGCISAQVLSELFVALTRKIRVPLTVRDGIKRIEHHSQIWRVLDVTALEVLEALRGVRAHRFGYWDALIWATARLNQIPTVFSEDFTDGAIVEGIRFANPFAPKFQIADWL